MAMAYEATTMRELRHVTTDEIAAFAAERASGTHGYIGLYCESPREPSPWVQPGWHKAIILA